MSLWGSIMVVIHIYWVMLTYPVLIFVFEWGSQESVGICIFSLQQIAIIKSYFLLNDFIYNCISKHFVALGTIHILHHHIFGIFGPPSPLRQHVFSTKNKQKLAFSDPPPPYKC